MEFKNTPDARFENLPDYPFQPNYYLLADGMRMHYIDEGPQNGPIALLMHGEPSWSFLYRFMIPVFVEAGYRVLCPDLIGFGKSSKPTTQSDYSYKTHIAWTRQWLDSMNLSDINLFAQDWGGLIGLRLVTDQPDLFASITVGNTGLPTGEHTPPAAFLQWQKFSQKVEDLPVGKILQNSTVRTLTPEEVAAYEAPFPDPSYQAGAKIFPALVPTKPTDPGAAENKKGWGILMRWNKPLLCLFSDKDPITKRGERPFLKLVPGAQHEDHSVIAEGGHFLQEDKGPEIAQKMIEFLKKQ